MAAEDKAPGLHCRHDFLSIVHVGLFLPCCPCTSQLSVLVYDPLTPTLLSPLPVPPCRQHTVMAAEDKVFGVHTYHDLLADYLLDLGIPQAAVTHDAVEAFLTLSEGVRVCMSGFVLLPTKPMLKLRSGILY